MEKQTKDLAQLLDIDINHLDEYKFHAASWNGKTHPLDAYIKDDKGVGEVGGNWKGWQTWYGGKNRWTRKYILSFMRFNPEGDPDVWLFGGIFEVKGLNIPEEQEQGDFYDVDLTDQGREYIGRLKIIYHHQPQQSYLKLEKCYPELKLGGILKVPYSGGDFNGYEKVSLNFSKFESIVRSNKDDWRVALHSIKGIYVIFDKKTGKKYVGSAYGEDRIWGRWCCYVDSLHGGNKKLKELFSNDQDMLGISQEENPIDYARKNFRLTLIEWWPYEINETFIRGRENYWKEALLSKGEFGYNSN